MEKKAKAEAKRIRRTIRKQGGGDANNPLETPDGELNGEPNGEPGDESETADGEPKTPDAATDAV